jgi:hypothetical protein
MKIRSRKGKKNTLKVNVKVSHRIHKINITSRSSGVVVEAPANTHA